MTVYVDTNIIIYLVEQNPAWLARVIARFTRSRAAGDQIVASDLTIAECMVGPFRSGDAVAESSYRSVFADPDIQILPVDLAACERAARIRAVQNFGMIDALHLAVAAENGCGLFLTNDLRLARCTDIRVEVLT